MTLVGAVNPDFGQVEVDPAVVNLSAFETFFEEKRPFFTEGSQVFLRFGRSGASEYTTYFYPEPQLFYSRRIGRAPQGGGAGDFVDTPVARRPSSARPSSSGAPAAAGTSACWRPSPAASTRGSRRVRPATGSRSSRSRTTSWAARSTPSARARRSASWAPRSSATSTPPASTASWSIEPSWEASTATSSSTASTTGSSPGASRGAPSPAARPRCSGCRRAAPRYYQRPDAPHVSVDPAATSLSGWSGRVGLNKNSGNVTFNAGLWGISPGFEPNDIGFATQTDRGGGPRPGPLPEADPGRVDPQPAPVCREVVDLQLREREPGRRRDGGGGRAAAQLLAARPDARQVLEHVGRQAHAGRPDHDPARHREPGPRGVERRPAARLGHRHDPAHEPRVRRPQPAVLGRPSTSGRWTALTLSATPTYVRSAHRRPVPRHRCPTRPPPRRSAAATSSAASTRTRCRSRCGVNLVLSPKLSLQLYTQALLSAGDYPTIQRARRAAHLRLPGLRPGRGHDRPRPRPARLRHRPRRGGDRPVLPDPRPRLQLQVAPRQRRPALGVPPGSAAYVVWTQRRQDGRTPATTPSAATSATSSPPRPTTCSWSRSPGGSAAETTLYNQGVASRASWPGAPVPPGRRARRRPEPYDHRRRATRHDARTRDRGLGSQWEAPPGLRPPETPVTRRPWRATPSR